MEIWSLSAIGKYCNLFPSPKNSELIDTVGNYEVKLEAIIDKIKIYRKSFQNLLLSSDERDNKKTEHPYSANCSGGCHCAGRRRKRSADRVVVIKSLVTFKAPKRDEDCRICKALESRGDTKHLYDGHVSNFPTGCPRYIAFSIGERRKIASEAKLCWSCHDPKYFHKPESSKKHREECMINKGR